MTKRVAGFIGANPLTVAQVEYLVVAGGGGAGGSIGGGGGAGGLLDLTATNSADRRASCRERVYVLV